MGIESKRIEPHWNYLLALDADLVNVSRFVEFHRRNFDCFSIEIARLLLTASAEVDVVCKQLCKTIDPASTAESIHQYRDVIRPARPGETASAGAQYTWGARYSPNTSRRTPQISPIVA
jgi:hypothetical protein